MTSLVSPAVVFEFWDAMAKAGIHVELQHIIADGHRHYATGIGERRNKSNVRYCLGFGRDGRVLGFAIDFKSDARITFRPAKETKPLTAEEKRYWARQHQELEKQDRQRHARAEAQDAMTLARARPASADHRYLIKKGVPPLGLLQLCGDLIVPLQDVNDRIRHIQTIDIEDGKRFTPGAVIGSLFHVVGGQLRDGATIAITEGWATGASVFLATSFPTCAAMSARNLSNVAKALRFAYPGSQLIICADRNEIGLKCAHKAADLYGGTVIAPPEPGDWNDFCNACGFREVARLITELLDARQCARDGNADGAALPRVSAIAAD